MTTATGWTPAWSPGSFGIPSAPTPGGGIVTLDQLKVHVGIRDTADVRDDTELQLMLDAALRIIGDLVGAILPEDVVDVLAHGQTLLSRCPAYDVTVSTYGTPATDVRVNGAAGLLLAPLHGERTVTYKTGRPVVSANIKLALLELVAHWWRQAHGGSETNVPNGQSGFTPGTPMTHGIPNRVRDILGPDLRAPHVA